MLSLWENMAATPASASPEMVGVRRQRRDLGGGQLCVGDVVTAAETWRRRCRLRRRRRRRRDGVPSR